MKRTIMLNVLAVSVAVCLAAGMAFGQAKAPAKSAPSAPAQKQNTKQPSAKPNLIDINSASKEELMAIPGIGDAYAQKIIDNRPYRAKNELVQKNILPKATYDKIAGQIVARRTTAASGKSSTAAAKKPSGKK